VEAIVGGEENVLSGGLGFWGGGGVGCGWGGCWGWGGEAQYYTVAPRWNRRSELCGKERDYLKQVFACWKGKRHVKLVQERGKKSASEKIDIIRLQQWGGWKRKPETLVQMRGKRRKEKEGVQGLCIPSFHGISGKLRKERLEEE